MKRLLITLAVFLLPARAFALSDQYVNLVGTDSARANYTANATSTPVCVTDGRASDLVLVNDADYVSGSSTLDVKVQHSPDRTAANFKDLYAFTRVTTVDAIENIDVPNDSVHPLKCFRVIISVGAGSPNYNLRVRLYFRPRA